MAGRFNELEVTVGANTRGLNQGLRNANRSQRRYATNTERTFGLMQRRMGRFARAGGMGVAGAMLGGVGLGIGGAAAATGLMRAGDQFNQLTEMQKRSLTTGQRQWRQFAGAIALEAGRLRLKLEERLGGMAGMMGLARPQMTETQVQFERQMRDFVSRTPIGAARRGRDVQAITQIFQARRRRAAEVQFQDFIRRERERANQQQEPGGFQGGARPAVPQSPMKVFGRRLARDVRATDENIAAELGRQVKDMAHRLTFGLIGEPVVPPAPQDIP